MSTRRKFISLSIGTGAFFLFPHALHLIQRPKWHILPGINGDIKVRLNANEPSVANAQGWYPYYDAYDISLAYDTFLLQQQMIALEMQMWEAQQQIINEWAAYWYTIAQQLQWEISQHQNTMNNYLLAHPGYQYAGRPQPWQHVRSIYALARDEYSQPIFFGANSSGKGVAIQKTLKGADAVFKSLVKNVSRGEAERSVGPQSSEMKAKLIFDGKQHEATGYVATNGALAVSNNNNFQSSDGNKGNLVKFVSDKGEKYLVV